MRTLNRIIVSAVIESSDGNVLLCKKPDTNSIYAGKWVIPGGGVEDGEDFRTALIREMREEVGLDVAPYEHILVDESGDSQEKYLRDTGETVWAVMQFYTYHIVLPTPAAETRIVIDDEHVAFQFVPITDLASFDMPQPSLRLFTKIGYISA